MQRLILVDPVEAMCDAWRAAFAPYAEVEIVNGWFEALPAYDCMVSAANSFGLMDGGVDRAISAYFGPDLQQRVQAHILAHYNGEQPVGTSFIVPTGHAQHPFLAHTPTMRVPASIAATDHVYLAMKAMLQAVQDFNAQEPRISTVACPGLGTATGRMPYAEAARQMALAYAYYQNPPQQLDWPSAAQRHRRIIGSDE